MSASDRVTLSELVDHSAAPKILDIHLDDCEDDRCAGCEPQHLAERAAAVTARARLEAMAFQLATGNGLVEPKVYAATLDDYRTEILSEVADLLMQADETAAALLVDRLREGGESRG